MKNYIGIDAHCKYCDIAVVSGEGKLLSHLSVKTSAENLIEAVKKVRGERAVVVEESTLADWLQRTLSPYCDRFQVCDPMENESIARSERKSDRHDAHTLAQLYRGGYTKAVHHTQDMRHLWHLFAERPGVRPGRGRTISGVAARSDEPSEWAGPSVCACDAGAVEEEGRAQDEASESSNWGGGITSERSRGRSGCGGDRGGDCGDASPVPRKRTIVELCWPGRCQI